MKPLKKSTRYYFATFFKFHMIGDLFKNRLRNVFGILVSNFVVKVILVKKNWCFSEAHRRRDFFSFLTSEMQFL